jgi:hypothetical protein
MILRSSASMWRAGGTLVCRKVVARGVAVACTGYLWRPAAILRRPDRSWSICDAGSEVDALYDQVYRELLTYMLSDTRTIERATRLTWVAHNLERIADRATNICEQVVNLVEGRSEELNVSKY